MKFVDVIRNFNVNGSQYYTGERCKVSDEDAARFCRAGWAKDPTGELETLAPNTGEVKLDIQNGKHASAASKVGVE